MKGSPRYPPLQEREEISAWQLQAGEPNNHSVYNNGINFPGYSDNTHEFE